MINIFWFRWLIFLVLDNLYGGSMGGSMGVEYKYSVSLSTHAHKCMHTNIPTHTNRRSQPAMRTFTTLSPGHRQDTAIFPLQSEGQGPGHGT